MILHKFGSVHQGTDFSPFCTKVEAHLRMLDIPHEAKDTAPFAAPRGKLPYLVDGDEVIGDSSAIVEHLARRGWDANAHLDDTQRGEVRLIQSAIEEHLYFLMLYFRWQDEEGWSGLKPYFDRILSLDGGPPVLLHPLVKWYARRNGIKQLHAQGTGRQPREEALSKLVALYDSLESWLLSRSGPFAFGEQACSIDAILFAFLDCAQLPIPGPLHDELSMREGLCAHVAHFRAEYWA